MKNECKIQEFFPHDACPKCGAASVPAENVPDQTLRGCPECSHTWAEDLSRPARVSPDLLEKIPTRRHRQSQRQ